MWLTRLKIPTNYANAHTIHTSLLHVYTTPHDTTSRFCSHCFTPHYSVLTLCHTSLLHARTASHTITPCHIVSHTLIHVIHVHHGGCMAGRSGQTWGCSGTRISTGASGWFGCLMMRCGGLTYFSTTSESNLSFCLAWPSATEE